MVVIADTFNQGGDDQAPKLAVNLLLELFGEAELLRGNLIAFVPSTVHRLNWEVLPPGRHPWTRLELKVRDVLREQGERKRPVFERRWSTISGYGPDFTAVGRAGFRGYVIFGFTDRELYILESAYCGNATYVLDRDWESLAGLTKAELLNEGLHRDRIIHRENWDARICDLLE